MPRNERNWGSQRFGCSREVLLPLQCQHRGPCVSWDIVALQTLLLEVLRHPKGSFGLSQQHSSKGALWSHWRRASPPPGALTVQLCLLSAFLCFSIWIYQQEEMKSPGKVMGPWSVWICAQCGFQRVEPLRRVRPLLVESPQGQGDVKRTSHTSEPRARDGWLGWALRGGLEPWLRVLGMTGDVQGLWWSPKQWEGSGGLDLWFPWTCWSTPGHGSRWGMSGCSGWISPLGMARSRSWSWISWTMLF